MQNKKGAFSELLKLQIFAIYFTSL